jgi:outer membrane protein TolC
VKAKVQANRWIQLTLAGALLGSLAGCASPGARSRPAPPAAMYAAGETDNPSLHQAGQQAAVAGGPFRQVGLVSSSPDASDPFAAEAELSVDHLVAEVELRNPSLQAAWAAWRAAAQRYPQAVALDDPMFGFAVSPNGAGRDEGGGWMVEASQKIPWGGKRALRGSAAEAEADAARSDLGEARLQLAQAARTAFADYYLAVRQMEVNRATVVLLQQFRQIAKSKYEVNQATQQDVLQADVELAGLESRHAELTRDCRVAMARINTLLHRAADYPLPPPALAAVADALPDVESLEQSALQCRPDLAARCARIHVEEAKLELAQRECYPDLELVAKYDAFMPVDMRSQLGMNFNVPLQSQRREAAVCEAMARLQQRRAEYQEGLDQARYEVQAAWDRLLQQRQVIRLYGDNILPTAQRALQSAQANYTAGKLDFLRLIDAQRQYHGHRELYFAALADGLRRRAELERAVGTLLPR